MEKRVVTILDNKVIKNENLSTYAKAVYISIKRMSFNYNKILYTTPQVIEATLGINNPTKRTTKAIVDGLKELIANDIIQCNEDNIKANGLLKIEGIDSRKTSNFTVLDIETLDLLIEKEDIKTVVAYAVIVSNINCQKNESHYKMGWESQETLSALVGISVSTFVKITDRLEELKIICTIRSKGKKKHNYYCLYENKDKCIAHMKSRGETPLTKEQKGATLKKKEEVEDILNREVAFGRNFNDIKENNSNKVVDFVPKAKVVKVTLHSKKDKKNTVDVSTVKNKLIDLDNMNLNDIENCF